jgi:pimeloyl-ACP methyl ester carboxylesterase
MTQYTVSKDGTKIAWSKTGKGQPVIVIDGALCHRNFGANMKLPQYLNEHFTVYTYDRRGKGESGNKKPFALQREFEDLQSLIDVVGESPFVYGISSGAALALEAANHGLSFKKLALYEAPYIVDDSRRPIPQDYLQTLEKFIAAGENGKALNYFLKAGAGLPAYVVLMMRLMPVWKQVKSIVDTVIFDTLAIGSNGSGEKLTAGKWPGVRIPVLLISGSKSQQWIRNAMLNLAEVLPDSTHLILKGETHTVNPKMLAPHLISFFKSLDQ